MTRLEHIAFIKGKLEGLYDFAWMKDSVLHLGSGIYTYKSKADPLKEQLSLYSNMTDDEYNNKH